jgi:hypothetical protein
MKHIVSLCRCDECAAKRREAGFLLEEKKSPTLSTEDRLHQALKGIFDQLNALHKISDTLEKILRALEKRGGR